MPTKLWQLQAAIGTRPVIAAASTHPGEEIELVDVHRRLKHSFPGLLTILVPRHPERGPGIAGIARGAGLKFAQRSLGELPDRDTEIYIADTLGELGVIYRRRADRVHRRLAGRSRRTESDRGRQARRRHPARPACLEFRRNLFGARCRRRRRDGHRHRQADGADRRVAQGCRGAQEGGADRTSGDGHAGRRARTHGRGARSLSDAVPAGAARGPRDGRTMREPSFWWRPAGPERPACCRRWLPFMERSRHGGWRGRAAPPASPSSASAI